MLLPVFRKQFDEGKQVNRGFKHHQLLIRATVRKSERFFCSGYVLPELLINATAACIAWVSVCIPSHKDHIVVGGVLVNISGGDEEVHQ